MQSLVGPDRWRYVPSSSNAADIATRGIDPVSFQSYDLWWYGPKWLSSSEENWPDVTNLPEITASLDLEEIKVAYHISSKKHAEHEIICKYGILTKITRVIAYMLRFLYNGSKKNRKSRLLGHLINFELNRALFKVCSLYQQDFFEYELKQLSKRQPILSSSKLVSLNPFLDKNNVLKVGGRLQLSAVPYDNKHPILLARNSHLSKLIIIQAHLSTLHGGH